MEMGNVVDIPVVVVVGGTTPQIDDRPSPQSPDVTWSLAPNDVTCSHDVAPHPATKRRLPPLIQQSPPTCLTHLNITRSHQASQPTPCLPPPPASPTPAMPPPRNTTTTPSVPVVSPAPAPPPPPHSFTAVATSTSTPPPPRPTTSPATSPSCDAPLTPTTATTKPQPRRQARRMRSRGAKTLMLCCWRGCPSPAG